MLAQHNEVIAVDIIPKKVKLINDILSPIKDEYIKKYFKKENLNLYATLDYENAYKDVDFVVIATPTNYDSDKNYFDTSTVEDVIKQVIKIKSQSKHFIERVFGTKNDPMHNNRARSGVSLENIKDAILSDKEPIYSSKNDSFVFTNSKCQVSINANGNLIQTNPKKVKMKFILTKKQFDFLITLDNVNNFILKHSFENNNVIFFVDDISSFQDIIYFNVVEYGMDKEGAINSKGKQIYTVYDELLSQI